MTQEEKLEEAKRLYETANADQRYVLESLFPELAESKDERIRKALIRFHKSTIDVDGIKGEDVIAWLEKQGEQKPILDFNADDWYVSKVDGKIRNIYQSVDKVEPKFEVGDVLCDKSCTTLNKESQPNFEITDIRNGMYICDKCSFPISQQDEYELVAQKIEQNSAWSEEDEEILRTIISDGIRGAEFDMLQIDWLKSLKQRIGG